VIFGIGAATVGTIYAAGRWLLRADRPAPAPAPAPNAGTGEHPGPLLGWDGASIEQYYLDEELFT
jgi:hypothetical protein